MSGCTDVLKARGYNLAWRAMLVVAASEGKCDGEQDEGKEVEAINAELELELAFAVHAPNSKARVQAVPIEVSSAASSAPRLEFSPAEYASLTERKTGFRLHFFFGRLLQPSPARQLLQPPSLDPDCPSSTLMAAVIESCADDKVIFNQVRSPTSLCGRKSHAAPHARCRKAA